MKKKVLVVDLDGTLYSINTFHFFLRFVILSSFKKLKLLLALKIIGLIFFRILKLISHSKLKFHVLLALQHFESVDYEKFVDSIQIYKHDIEELNFPYRTKIMATAAPACYAKIIANRYGFDFCSATETSHNEFLASFENSKGQKKTNVLKMLNTLGFDTIDTFITDHRDDLPLIQISKETILINPDTKLLQILKGLSVQYDVRRI